MCPLDRDHRIRYAHSVNPRPPRPSPPDQHLVEKRILADQPAAARMLRRIASEVVERLVPSAPVAGQACGFALVGIRTGGLYLAETLRRLIAEIEGVTPPLGAVDITLYRDDVFVGLSRPEVGPTELPFDLAGVTVVLVDDVLYTGRTVRAALDALMDFGRPRAVQLAVLVDRGLRELPIRADYVGLAVETTPDESVRVVFSDRGSVERVVLRERRTP
jgi:pyrimidine operon attenuation protein/uracil phosphoribosyltransferase